MKNETAIIHYSTKGTNRHAAIQLHTDLVIKYSQAITKELNEAEVNSTSLLLLLKEGSNIDIAGVQILIAFAKKARQNQKDLQLELSVSEECKALLERAGCWNKITHLT